MNIRFILARPELGGGVKVVFQLAEMSARLGHNVEVRGHGPRPTWTDRFSCQYKDVDDVNSSASQVDHTDLAVGTYYTTFDEAEALDARTTVHFCQGVEYDLEHLAAEKTAIEEVYKRPYPVLTVNPALGRRLAKEYGKSWLFVPPPLDQQFFPLKEWKPWSRRPRRAPVIIVPGVFEAPVKGVKIALEVLRLLEQRGVRVTLMRISSLPLSEEEKAIRSPDEYFCAVSPEVVAARVRRADLLLFTSQPGEGFGLPVVEAAASGIPVIAFDLPAMRIIGIPSNCRIKLNNVHAMADAAMNVLGRPQEWQQTGSLILKRVRSRFMEPAVSRRLSQALLSLGSPVNR